MGFRADVRAACVTLLEAYKTSAAIKLQIYPGRPASVNPPTAFVDLMPMTHEYVGPTLVQKQPLAQIVVLHGTFDSKEATTQADTFVDGFMDYVKGQYHAAGANTLIAAVSVEDVPVYTPDWFPANARPEQSYYASIITLEGYAEG